VERSVPSGRRPQDAILGEIGAGRWVGAAQWVDTMTRTRTEAAKVLRGGVRRAQYDYQTRLMETALVVEQHLIRCTPRQRLQMPAVVRDAVEIQMRARTEMLDLVDLALAAARQEQEQCARSWWRQVFAYLIGDGHG
jgi:hypothetical protein